MKKNGPDRDEVPQYDASEDMYIEKCINGINEAINRPLVILIWGPTEPSNNSNAYDVDLYKKRVEIKDYLKTLGHTVLFSEDIGRETERRTGSKFNPKLYEEIQIDLADLAIMLRVSYGTTAEFHDFHDHPNYARKMCVYFDKDHKDSYTHAGADKIFVSIGGSLEEFTYPTDITECYLKNKIATYIKKVQAATFITAYRKY